MLIEGAKAVTAPHRLNKIGSPYRSLAKAKADEKKSVLVSALKNPVDP